MDEIRNREGDVLAYIKNGLIEPVSGKELELIEGFADQVRLLSERVRVLEEEGRIHAVLLKAIKEGIIK